MADRRVSVNVDADVSAFVRGMMTASAASKAFGSSLKSNGPLLVQQEKELDRYSGRLRLLGEAAATIGPAFIPLGGAAVQALGGLSAGLLAAGAAAGTAMLAFQGVGDGLKALNDYQLDPTAAHLKKVEQAFEKLGPAGEDFVLYLDSIGGQLKGVQNLARAGMFPGMEEGIDSLLTLLPQVRQIVRNVSTELGTLAADAGDALSGERWTPFFDYIQTDAAPTLRDFAESVGNVAEGFGSLLVAFAPLNRDFSSGLEDMTQKFADWARTVSQTQGFEDFVDYLRESGPQAMDFLGAIANALVGIVSAAAPFGQAVLPALTALANVLAAIANSPVGGPLFTAAAGFIALNRAVSTFGPGLAKLNEAFLDLRTSPNAAATAAERFGGAIRGLAGAAGVGLFVTSINETNTSLKAFEGIAGGALTGLAVGGPWGAAIGAGIGALTLFGDKTQENTAYIDALSASLDKQTGAFTENSNVIAAKALEEQGVLKTAQDLGLSLDTVTQAALGNKDALAEINSELERFANVDTASGVDADMFKQRKEGAELSKTLKGLAGDSDSAVASAERLAQATDGAAGAAKGARRTFHDESLALDASRDAASESASKFITLGDSLDDAKVSLNGWLKQLQQQANALEAFGNNAARAAHRGLDQGLIASLEAAGPVGAMRMKQLANATDSELARANKAWRDGQRAIRDYVNIAVPPKKITVDNGQAFDAINAVRYALSQIHDKTINVSAIYHRGAIDVATRASGGTVPGQRRPYGDKTLILAAPGEEVITNRNGEADAFRADRAAGRIPRYAGGGTVGGLGGGVSLDQRLEIAQALGTIRDLTHQLNDKVDKGKNKGEYATRGIERKILELQLKAAERDLHRAKNADEREAKAKKREDVQGRIDAATQRGQDAIEAAKGRLGDLTGMRDSLAGGITSSLQSDIWARTGQSGKGPANPLAALTKDITSAQRFLTLEQSLTARGLTGDAFSNAASQGGLAGLETLSGFSDEQLGQYASLYAQRQSLTTQAGTFAGDQRYGQEIAAQSKQIADMTALLQSQVAQIQAELTAARAQQPANQSKYANWVGEAVGREINSVAASAGRGSGRGGVGR